MHDGGSIDVNLNGAVPGHALHHTAPRLAQRIVIHAENAVRERQLADVLRHLAVPRHQARFLKSVEVAVCIGASRHVAGEAAGRVLDAEPDRSLVQGFAVCRHLNGCFERGVKRNQANAVVVASLPKPGRRP